MQRTVTRQDIRGFSGEQLLVLTIIGDQRIKQAVDRELDRRARFGRAYERPAMQPSRAA